MRKNKLITGTLILTAAGFASRFIGFFYRIFLSRMFSAEQMGIYELINPILALCYALCTSGIQNAISKYTASCIGPDAKNRQLRVLLSGLFFSLFLSAGYSFAVYRFSDQIAQNLLMEERCAPLLRIIALSFPAACVHSCINGYYYGTHKTGLPAFCQLVEQIFRVGSVFLFWQYSITHPVTFRISAAAVGLVIGEVVSAVLSIVLTWIHFTFHTGAAAFAGFRKADFSPLSLLIFALPLTFNRVCLNLLSAAEAAWIPVKLTQYGFTDAEALSVYGTLTGMAMTCIFFPTAMTNSVAVLIMPLVSSADAGKNRDYLKRLILKCSFFCLSIGFVCMLFFYIAGLPLGNLLFHNADAGHFIRSLSFLCPFLYLNTTLFSVQNGLGKTGLTFFANLCAIGIRLFFVFFCIPALGVSGYLYGLFVSQIFVTLFHLFTLGRFFSKISDS